MFKKQQNIFLISFLFILFSISNNIEARQYFNLNKIQKQENPDFKIMFENLAKLMELKDLQKIINKTNNKARGVSYMVDQETQMVFGKNCYRVRVGINGKYRWEGHYIFYVNTTNLKEFFIEDTIVGDIVIIEVWRDRERKRNKSLELKKLYKIFDVDGYTNLRKEKNKTSEILQKIKSGENIEVLNNDGDWYQVRTKEGKNGYVNKSRIISE